MATPSSDRNRDRRDDPRRGRGQAPHHPEERPLHPAGRGDGGQEHHQRRAEGADDDPGEDQRGRRQRAGPGGQAPDRGHRGQGADDRPPPGRPAARRRAAPVVEDEHRPERGPARRPRAGRGRRAGCAAAPGRSSPQRRAPRRPAGRAGSRGRRRSSRMRLCIGRDSRAPPSVSTRPSSAQETGTGPVFAASSVAASSSAASDPRTRKRARRPGRLIAAAPAGCRISTSRSSESMIRGPGRKKLPCPTEIILPVRMRAQGRRRPAGPASGSAARRRSPAPGSAASRITSGSSASSCSRLNTGYLIGEAPAMLRPPASVSSSPTKVPSPALISGARSIATNTVTGASPADPGPHGLAPALEPGGDLPRPLGAPGELADRDQRRAARPRPSACRW